MSKIKKAFVKAGHKIDDAIDIIANRNIGVAVSAFLIACAGAAAGAGWVAHEAVHELTESSTLSTVSTDPAKVAEMKTKIDHFVQVRDKVIKTGQTDNRVAEEARDFMLDLYTHRGLSEKDFEILHADYKTRVNFDLKSTFGSTSLLDTRTSIYPKKRDECLNKVAVDPVNREAYASKIEWCMQPDAAPIFSSLIAGALGLFLGGGLAIRTVDASIKRRENRKNQLKN